MFAKGKRQPGAKVDLSNWSLPAVDDFSAQMSDAALKIAGEAIEHILADRDGIYTPVENGDRFDNPGGLVLLVVMPLGSENDYEDEPKWAVPLDDILDPENIDPALYPRLREVLKRVLEEIGDDDAK